MRGELEELRDYTIFDESVDVYSYDGFPLVRGRPKAVILPRSVEELRKAIELLYRKKISYTVRGSGSGLSGAFTPINSSIVISLSKLNRVIEVDKSNRVVVVEPGIANMLVSKEVGPDFFYSPDPSSYSVCSIGGNVSHDSGGIHVPKYGSTFSHVLGIEVITVEGKIVKLGALKRRSYRGLDPRSVFIGSEGTIGVIAKVYLRIIRKPEVRRTLMAVFNTVEEASKGVVEVFRAGIIPSALEMIDDITIDIIERSRYKSNYPIGKNILLIEIDGNREEVEGQKEKVLKALKFAEKVIEPKDKYEEEILWRGRRGAFPAMGVVSSSYLTMDVNIPRSKLTKVLKQIRDMSENEKMIIANVFHAGDGNLHPLIPYDQESQKSVKKAIRLSEKIVEMAIREGGTISGEHGIGVEKLKFMPLYYDEESLRFMFEFKKQLDPYLILNPCKMFPPDYYPECSKVEEEVVAEFLKRYTPWEVMG